MMSAGGPWVGLQSRILSATGKASKLYGLPSLHSPLNIVGIYYRNLSKLAR